MPGAAGRVELLQRRSSLRAGGAMATILMPIPNSDFDPTETAVPWKILRDRGHTVVFATPNGGPGHAGPRMVTGEGLGILAPFLRANANARRTYQEMEQSSEFKNPIS